MLFCLKTVEWHQSDGQNDTDIKSYHVYGAAENSSLGQSGNYQQPIIIITIIIIQ